MDNFPFCSDVDYTFRSDEDYTRRRSVEVMRKVEERIRSIRGLNLSCIEEVGKG